METAFLCPVLIVRWLHVRSDVCCSKLNFLAFPSWCCCALPSSDRFIFFTCSTQEFYIIVCLSNVMMINQMTPVARHSKCIRVWHVYYFCAPSSVSGSDLVIIVSPTFVSALYLSVPSVISISLWVSLRNFFPAFFAFILPSFPPPFFLSFLF